MELRLLRLAWESSIAGQQLFQREGDDLRLILQNAKAHALTSGLISEGDLLGEAMPGHHIPRVDGSTLLGDYLEIVESQRAREVELFFEGDGVDSAIDGWWLNSAVGIDGDKILMSFVSIDDRKQAEQGLLYEANHDALTGLYNRRHLSHADPTGVNSAIYVDLDGFKLVNDLRGHRVGDRLLQAVAEILRAIARRYRGTAWRWGGDEFFVALPTPDPSDVAVQILSAIHKVSMDGATISASIGCASLPVAFFEGSTLDRLELAAESAAMMAKADKGSNEAHRRIREWDPEATRLAVRRGKVEQVLRQRFERQFTLHYQPIVRLGDRHIVGCEALARCTNTALGTIPPDEFIAVAEAIGAIYRLSRWAIATATRQLSEWSLTHPNTPLVMSVNISPQELEIPGFPDFVTHTLRHYGCQPHEFSLEITERGLFRNSEEILRSMQRLHSAGVICKIDDFGTGESGLSRLLEAPVRALKIDRSLVPITPADTKRLAICQAISVLAQGMHLEVIAEGVETEDQAALLIDIGVEYGQGWLYSKALPAKDFGRLLGVNS